MEILVLFAGAWAVLALAFLHLKAKGYGQRKLLSAPAGEPSEGVAYVFTKGMAPWAKESVMLNLPSYGAGLAFHSGVFSAFGLLLAAILRLELPPFLVILARILTAAGTIGGFSLLVKRIIKPQLRGLSCPDDFVSNLLSSFFVALAFARTFSPSLDGLWMVEAVLLLIYAPLGKIRHCFFFFTTRYHLGAFFGRRGVFPPHT